MGGPGAGTITAISGSKLTLRTENGTETVDTSSSTTYTKELQTISFSGLHVGDIVNVAGTPGSTGSSSSTPPQPGTGTVNASAVVVVKPSLGGRVSSASSGTYNLIGPGGQQLTVKTTGSTRYYKGTYRSSSSAISTGSHVMAEGTQSGLTDLTADVIAVMPTPPSPPVGGPARPTRSGSATTGPRGSSTTPSSSSSTSGS